MDINARDGEPVGCTWDTDDDNGQDVVLIQINAIDGVSSVRLVHRIDK